MIKATCKIPIYDSTTQHRISCGDVCDIEILITSVGELVRVIDVHKKEVQITIDAFRIAFHDLRT